MFTLLLIMAYYSASFKALQGEERDIANFHRSYQFIVRKKLNNHRVAKRKSFTFGNHNRMNSFVWWGSADVGSHLNFKAEYYKIDSDQIVLFYELLR